LSHLSRIVAGLPQAALQDSAHSEATCNLSAQP